MTSELMAKDDPVKVERARVLIGRAAKALDEFEDYVRELVTMRAWVVLGYKDFAEMWVGETGFKCPTHAKVLAVETLSNEGMATRTGFGPGGVNAVPDGHTNLTIAENVGLPVYAKGERGRSSPVTHQIRRQLDHGVPANKVMLADAYSANRQIDRHGIRSRSTNRRIGKGPEENVQAAVYLPRRDDDAMSEWARKMGVPKSEVYRQAVIEYLDRHNINTHYGDAPNGAVPQPKFSDPT